MEKMDIFIKKLKDNITNGSNEEQLFFLKIYPVFREKVDIYKTWLEVYVAAKSTEAERNKIINFIILALSNNFVDYKSGDIFALIKTMHDLNEDDRTVELVKINAINGRSANGVRKNTLLNMITKKNKENITYDMRNFTPHEIATELTVRSNTLIKYMSYHEIIRISLFDNLKFDSNDPQSGLKLIDDFHKLSYMVPTMILLKDNNNITRIKTIKYLLKICAELKYLHNYNSLFAIIAGLNNLAVQKITQLWKPSTSHYELFTELCNFISPLGNFGRYRIAIKKNSKYNHVPYIGTIIFDMKHALENDLYDTANQDFNWDLCRRIMDIMNELKNIGENVKLKNSDQVCDWFSSLVICDDEDKLYDTATTIINNKKKTDLSPYSSREENSSESGSPVRIKSKLHGLKHKYSSSEGSESESSNAKFGAHRGSLHDGNTSRAQRVKIHERSVSAKLPPINISSIPEGSGDSPRELTSPSSGSPRITITESPRETSQSPVKKDIVSVSDPFLEYIVDNYKTEEKNSIKLKKIFRRKSMSPAPSDITLVNDFEKDMTNSKQVSLWTDKHIKIWLKIIGMETYCDAFAREEINGQVLLDLTEDHLRSDLGVIILGHRLLILKSIDTLRSKTPTNTKLSN